MSGLFISLEGLDGCGKSTQVQLLADWIREGGRFPLVVREPGGSQISEKIRNLLLSRENGNMSPEAELLLYFAARAQLVREIIAPALEAGQVVIADRFGWATYAYQGYGRGMDLKNIDHLREIACGPIWPDHSFLLDIDLDVMKRRLGAPEGLDRMESSGDLFFHRTRQGYLDLAKKNAAEFTVINGNQPVSDIFAEIRGKVSQILGD